MTVPFLPIDVVIEHPIPLVGCFGSTAAEFAAALMILTMRETPGTWRRVYGADLSEALYTQHKAYPWLYHPTILPDFRELAKQGYANVKYLHLEHDSLLLYYAEFTDAGLEKLRAFVRT